MSRLTCGVRNRTTTYPLLARGVHVSTNCPTRVFQEVRVQKSPWHTAFRQNLGGYVYRTRDRVCARERLSKGVRQRLAPPTPPPLPAKESRVLINYPTQVFQEVRVQKSPGHTAFRHNFGGYVYRTRDGECAKKVLSKGVRPRSAPPTPPPLPAKGTGL